jgi:plasmid replication initiation protein
MPKGEGIIKFCFHPALVPILNRPAVFARIKLAILGQFVSKYAPVLYENLELYVNRETKIWEIAVDELRSMLGVGDKMKLFNHFRSYVLSPSIQEINDKSDFTVSVEEVRAKRGAGRKIERLVFTVEPKPEREAEEAELRHKINGLEGPLKQNKLRNQDMKDMFDGRTDRERGGPPLLHSSTIEEAREMFDSWDRNRPDIYFLEKEWMAYERSKTERARDPDKAFLGWLRKWKENREKTNNR